MKIAAINDFHGYLQPSEERVPIASPAAASTAASVAGGIERLATLVDRFRQKNRNFAFVSAGDLVGASPFISATFDDEPTIEAMNAAGLDFNGVGNHEFDGGVAHLRRLQSGGCPASGCKSGAAFAGARFGFLAANVIVTATGKPLFAPYGIKEYGGVKVAFIGLTLKATPSIVSPRGVAGLEFRDEADTVNALIPELKRQGIEAIVVLIHQGASTSGGPNECADPAGPIMDIAQRFDRAVDVIVSAHTHQAYICNVDGKLMTSAGSYGRFVTEIDLQIDRASRDVVAARAVNHRVTTNTPGNSTLSLLIERYSKLAAPLQRVVGRITTTFSRGINRDGESPLGHLIADAHLEATKAAGAVIAFMNPGGIRAPLAGKEDGSVSFTDVFSVYPFNNTLITMTLTGSQILALLEQQWYEESTRVLPVSKGFSYAWNPSRPVGSRIEPDSVTLNGERLKPDAPYRVTVNSFMAEGGDGMKILVRGTERTAGMSSRDAIVRYLNERSPLSPARERRVRRSDDWLL